MISWRRFWPLVAAAFLAGVSARAQTWGVGASTGLVNSVEDRIKLSGFDRHDVNGWLQFALEDKVFLRATYGSLTVAGSNAGQTPVAGGPALPDLTDRINYGTLGISYELFEGEYTSGVFGGIGGYRVQPEGIDASIAAFRDVRQTVFGWHLGVDGSAKIFSGFSILGRLTFHGIRSTATRSIVTMNAGVAYRF